MDKIPRTPVSSDMFSTTSSIVELSSGSSSGISSSWFALEFVMPEVSPFRARL